MDNLSVDQMREKMSSTLEEIKNDSVGFAPRNLDNENYKSQKNANLLEHVKILSSSVENDCSPFLPSYGKLIIDTQPACFFYKDSSNGFVPWNNYLALVMKTQQIALAADSPEFIEGHFIEKAREQGYDVDIIQGEEPVKYILDSKASLGKTLNFYNICQVTNQDQLLQFLSKEFKERKTSRYEFLKEKYKENAFMPNTELKRSPANDSSKPFATISAKYFKQQKDSNGNDIPPSPKELAACMLGQIVAAGRLGMRGEMYPEDQVILKKGLIELCNEVRDEPYKLIEFGKEVSGVGKKDREESKSWADVFTPILSKNLKQVSKNTSKAPQQKALENEPGMDIF